MTIAADEPALTTGITGMEREGKEEEEDEIGRGCTREDEDEAGWSPATLALLH